MQSIQQSKKGLSSRRKVKPRKQFDFRPSCEKLEIRTVMSADAVLDWNDIALDAVANDHTPAFVDSPEQGGPTRTSRALAIVHAAIFDAVNAIDRSFTPYLLRSTAPHTASIDAAVAQAGHDTLSVLYPNPKQKAIFDAALKATLKDVPNGVGEQQGIRIGALAARTILEARSHDESDRVGFYLEIPIPGRHRADPLHPNQGFLGVSWGDVTPFTLREGSQFRADAPPKLTSAAYTAAFNEVKRLGGDGITTPTERTTDQTQIGVFWGYDGTPGLGTPPRLYNQITRTVAIQQETSAVQNARLFALVNLAMADAGVAAWDTKYVYDFWRPILGIREADPGTGPLHLGDFNPNTHGDVNWMPLGAPASNMTAGSNFTPPFPAYASGHATFGAATFRTLARFFGRDNFAFSFQSDEFNGVTTNAHGMIRPAKTRSFASFNQASQENADSRIYLGIHWRFDATEGIKQGNSVADWAFAHFLRPLASIAYSTAAPSHEGRESTMPEANSREPQTGIALPVSIEFAQPAANQNSDILVLRILSLSSTASKENSSQFDVWLSSDWKSELRLELDNALRRLF